MTADVRIITQQAGVVARVRGGDGARVDRLIGALGVQDQVGHVIWPRVRTSILVPVHRQYAINNQNNSIKLFRILLLINHIQNRTVYN